VMTAVRRFIGNTDKRADRRPRRRRVFIAGSSSCRIGEEASRLKSSSRRRRRRLRYRSAFRTQSEIGSKIAIMKPRETQMQPQLPQQQDSNNRTCTNRVTR
jgi:hypothetical protein